MASLGLLASSNGRFRSVKKRGGIASTPTISMLGQIHQTSHIDLSVE